MKSLLVSEFSDYCQQEKLTKFIVDSSIQSNLRFNYMRIRLEFDKVFTIPHLGVISFSNGNSYYNINRINNIIVREKVDNIITIFDIVCDYDINNIHTVIAEGELI